jgi:hypothetical protein
LVTTDLESSAEDLVARYASRWGIEQAFADAGPYPRIVDTGWLIRRRAAA